MKSSTLLTYGLLSITVFALGCSPAPLRRVSPSVTDQTADQTPGKGKVKPSPNTTTDLEHPIDPNDPDPMENPSDSAKDKPIPKPDTPKVEYTPSAYLETAFISSFLDDIAGPKGNGRGTGSPENQAVAQKIADEFKALGFKAGGIGGSYFQAFNAKGRETQNIIGILPGETDEFIVIGAHMDHLGSVNGQVYPGADDNASGTTGLIASARAFAKNPSKLKRSVVFIAFSGEEMGLIGSLYFVKNPTIDLQKIKFMVNMDMIGRYRQEFDVIGLEKTIEGNSIARELIAKTNVKPKYLGEVSAGGSDHMPFKQIGIPTGTFHTQLHDEYHQPTDTIDRLDKTNLKTIAGIASDLTFRLANSESITSAAYALIPIQLDGYTDGVHQHGGCEPALASFEEIQSNLSALKPIR
ncbi:MAG: M20/M25/M40 family metallo-hydrolase [Proteobacteria bacterium]|nr:MAG: M20/M25/M40 family metallo-hydrolase [Pseudomonadota bacterium]